MLTMLATHWKAKAENSLKIISLLGSLVIILSLAQQCGIHGLQHGPTPWHRIPRVDYQQPPYARYLEGLTFCLDPGHGGDAHIPNYKRGPTGVREAEMNLRVAFYLKSFLEEAGAKVILTRDGDYDVSLRERAAIANREQVNMFISLHHNAVDKPHVNYASTWYHADADYSPVSLDLARYIQQSLVDHLRLPDHLPTGLLSDYLMYPDGFGVLRYLEVPGILLESSFFSHPKEEKLLAKPAYNRLEAYAIFLGIARWAAAGIPKAQLISPTPGSSIADKQPTIRMKLSDGLHERRGAWMLPREQIFSRQISFFLDDTLAPFTFMRENSLVLHTPARRLTNGWHKVQVEFVNYHGNHNLPQKFYFRCASPAVRLEAYCPLPWLPADGISILPVVTKAYDDDNLPVADGDTVIISSERGHVLSTLQTVQRGMTIHYLQADTIPGLVAFTIKSGKTAMVKSILLKDTTVATIQGFVTTRDSLPLADAKIKCLPTGDSCRTDVNGFFLLPRYYPAGHYSILVQKAGYADARQEVELTSSASALLQLDLQPLYGGALHNFILVLDASVENVDTVFCDGHFQKINNLVLKWGQMLKALFEQAGAKVYLVNPDGLPLTAAKRVEISNQFPAGGFYLKIALRPWQSGQPSFLGGFYAGNEEGRKILTNLDSLLFSQGKTLQSQIKPSNLYEIINTNRAAISITLNLLRRPAGGIRNSADLSYLAEQVFRAFLQQYYPHPASQ